MNPRISVILTVYKRTEYLREALQSILQQTYTDFELIAVDDSGTANAKQIVASFSQDPRVRYLSNPQTIGVAASITQAVTQAHGDLVTIINDDDAWEPTFLEELTQPFFTDKNLVLTFSDHWLMDADGKINVEESKSWSAIFGRASLKPGIVSDPIRFTVANHGVPIANAAIFSKTAVDWSLVTQRIAGSYDYWISCLLLLKRAPIFYVNRRLSRWRTHPASETQRRSHDKGELLVHIYSELRRRNWFPEIVREIDAKLSRAILTVGHDKLAFGRVREARHYFLRSLRVKPRPAALLGLLATFAPRAVSN